ncbi:glycosyltransferase family 2 protein [Aquimarina sp. ERC-38]|uniref:glycosyltransferase family 2 protein n=1 Tax=Aquimarina sp. ERC-38 TaxID=2949996 RepID=UPI002AF6CCBC|nr:glycosyltransferase family 2 protein [Aquimarina sp. ERC-38]
MELCLHSVRKAIQTIDAEIIVVDNYSGDRSCDMVKEVFPEVILLENKENLGFAKANNQGVAIAKGTYICILNPDTVVAESTFTTLLQLYKNKENLGLTGIQLQDGSGFFLPESKRNIPTPAVSLQRLFHFRIGNVKSYYASHLASNKEGEVDILVGAFMFCERLKYQEVGGFDEDYFMYGEDIDLSYKFLKARYYNYYLGSISCIHYKGESTIKDKVYAARFYGAMQLFYKKHFATSSFTSFLVGLGVKLLSKVTQLKRNKIRKVSPNRYYFISTNQRIKKDIESTVKKEVELVNSFSEIIKEEKNIEIIFDAACLSFSEIIQVMQKNASPFITFKIKPPEQNFIIGSNSSTGRGEVIILKRII